MQLLFLQKKINEENKKIIVAEYCHDNFNNENFYNELKVIEIKENEVISIYPLSLENNKVKRYFKQMNITKKKK